MLTGGCYCGAIRYSLSAEPLHASLCHCADCRRIAAAPAVAWTTVPEAGFRVTRGSLARFSSSPNVTRGFCGACGTGVTYQHAELAGEIDITICSLDAPEQLPPQDQVWTRERLPWLPIVEGLPAFEQSGPSAAISKKQS